MSWQWYGYYIVVLKKWGDIGLVGKKPVSIVLAKYRREEYVATNQWACHLAGLSVAAERNNKSWVLALDLYTLTHAQFTWCNRQSELPHLLRKAIGNV